MLVKLLTYPRMTGPIAGPATIISQSGEAVFVNPHQVEWVRELIEHYERTVHPAMRVPGCRIYLRTGSVLEVEGSLNEVAAKLNRSDGVM